MEAKREVPRARIQEDLRSFPAEHGHADDKVNQRIRTMNVILSHYHVPREKELRWKK